MSRSVMIFGAAGQLGRELMGVMWPPDLEPVAKTHLDCDIADVDAVNAALDSFDARLVVNAAAYTAVDRAEAEPDLAYRVNAEGPEQLARACAQRRLPLIHISTDYVFDGSKSSAYEERDPIAPINVYGSTKAAGEIAVRRGLDTHVILRTSWVFGRHGANFVRTMLRLAAERDEIRVVADQHGTPTPADVLAQAIARIAAILDSGCGVWGTFHFAGDEAVTWYQLAETTIDRAAARLGRRPRVVPITTTEFPTAARRPRNSALDSALIGSTYGIPAARWRQGLNSLVDALTSPRDVSFQGH